MTAKNYIDICILCKYNFMANNFSSDVIINLSISDSNFSSGMNSAAANAAKAEAAFSSIGDVGANAIDRNTTAAKEAESAIRAFATENARASAAIKQLWSEEHYWFDTLKNLKNVDTALKDLTLRRMVFGFSELDQKVLGPKIKELDELKTSWGRLTKEEQLHALSGVENAEEHQKTINTLLEKYDAFNKKQKGFETIINGLSDAFGGFGGTIKKFRSDFMEFGMFAATAAIGMSLIVKAAAEADKLVSHYTRAMYDAGQSSLEFTKSVNDARYELGVTTDEIIKSGDAVYFAGIRYKKYGAQVKETVKLVQMLSTAYGVSEDASAGFVAVLTNASNDLNKSSKFIYSLGTSLHAAGLTASESTALFQKSAEIAWTLNAAHRDGGAAAMAYAKAYTILAIGAKRALVPLESLAEILDIVTTGGVEAIMLIGSAAFNSTNSLDGMEAALANLPNIEKRLASIPPWLLKSDPTLVKSLTGMTLKQLEALRGLAKQRAEIAAMAPEARKAMEDEESLAAAMKESFDSGSKSVQRFVETLTALLGKILVPINKLLGEFVNGLNTLSSKLESSGLGAINTFAAWGASLGLLNFGFRKLFTNTSSFKDLFTPVSSVFGVIKNIGLSLKDATTGQDGFFKSLIERMKPVKTISEQTSTATEKMTEKTGESTKTFLQKMAEGLRAFANVPAGKIFVVVASLALLGAVMVGMAWVIKEFNIGAGDMVMAAGALLTAVGIMYVAGLAMKAVGGAFADPVVWIAIAAIGILALAVIGVAYGFSLFSDSIGSLIGLWNSSTAWEILGWIGAAGLVLGATAPLLIVASVGLMTSSIGLIAFAGAALILGASLTDKLLTGVEKFSNILSNTASGLTAFSVAALSFPFAAASVLSGLALIGTGLLVFPLSWFERAGAAITVWSTSLNGLSDSVYNKLNNIKIALKELSSMSGVDLENLLSISSTIDIFTISLNKFTAAIDTISSSSDQMNKFAEAIERMVSAIASIKTISERDLEATINTVTSLIDNTTTATPIQRVTNINQPAVNNDDKIINLMEEQIKILTDIKDNGKDGNLSLRDILKKLSIAPDEYLGSPSLTGEASNW